MERQKPKNLCLGWEFLTGLFIFAMIRSPSDEATFVGFKAIRFTQAHAIALHKHE